MALYTFLFPEVIAKCGMCPYTTNVDDDETRILWLTLNDAVGVYEQGIQRYINEINVLQIKSNLAKKLEQLCEHFNQLSQRVLNGPVIGSDMFVQTMLSNEQSPIRQGIINIINDTGIKISENLVKIMPHDIVKHLAPVSLAESISYSWLQEIDAICANVLDLQKQKREEENNIQVTIAMAKNKLGTNQNIKYSRFNTMKWNSLSDRAQKDRLLYYAHVVAKQKGTQTVKEYTALLTEMGKSKVKWSAKEGIIESVDLPVSKPKLVRKKTKKHANDSDWETPFEKRHLELMVLFLASPIHFQTVEKNNQINVTKLTEMVTTASPKSDERYQNFDAVQELLSKALTKLDDHVTLST